MIKTGFDISYCDDLLSYNSSKDIVTVLDLSSSLERLYFR